MQLVQIKQAKSIISKLTCFWVCRIVPSTNQSVPSERVAWFIESDMMPEAMKAYELRLGNRQITHPLAIEHDIIQLD